MGTIRGDGPRRVVLSGQSGIGKTRLAKLVGEYATEEGLCYLTLCLHLNQKFEDEVSLYEHIAFQIEVYDGDDDESDRKDLLLDLKKLIIRELEGKKRLADEQMKISDHERRKILLLDNFPTNPLLYKHFYTSSHILLILDDEGNKTSEDKVMKDLGLESFLKDYGPLKILITRRAGDENTTKRDGETESHAVDQSQGTEIDGETKSQGAESDREIESDDMEEPHDTRNAEKIVSHTTFETHVDTKWKGKVEFHVTNESQALLNSLNERNMRYLLASLINDKSRELLNSLENAWKLDHPLISSMARKSNSLPAAIVVLAKSLNCITRQATFKILSPKQDKLFKEVLSPYEPDYSVSRNNSVLQLAYQLLETDDTLKNAIVDCFWHSLDFFEHCGCINYNELITLWILEGYFDPVRSVKKAYKDGHAILVELINRGILKIQDGDIVIPEMAMNQLTDLRYHGLFGRSQLLFSRVSCREKNKGVGKITQIDDMIKTVNANKGANICTMLVSGNRLRQETPPKFFEQMADLEVLILFDPTLGCLTRYLKNLCELRVLVIRNCGLLSDIEELQDLRELQVLEVSGASSVVNITDGFFKALPHLQSLNLSGLRIKSLPSSICQLYDLHSLILRDCLVLEDLPDIHKLLNLEVLDVRGARRLRTCFGLKEKTSRNRTFHHLTKLQLLDFSESNIKRLPVFHDAAMATNLHFLTRLLLRKCSNLLKLPNLKPLSGLQILDLSGTTSLVDIAAVCFEQKEELKILNLSGTKITKLPSTISGLSNLRQLLLRDNSNLEALPNISGLTSLEVFDVSGCTELHKIEGSFKDMSYLQEVCLSGTRIETIPQLPDTSNIVCSKLLVLADTRRLIHDTWLEVKEAMTNGISESLSSFDMVDRIQTTSRKEEGSVGELWAFDCPENKGRPREQFYQDHIYMDVYRNTIPFVDTKNCQEVLEIQGSNGVDQDKETLAKVEFVAIVDNSGSSLSSIFNDLKSVKSCWLEMCTDIEILFSGVDEESLGNLETLSITNIRPLKSICSSSLKNLKKLSLDCCPYIETLFPASALPTSLEVLKIKFCEKLEKVFVREVEVPNLHTLCLFNLPVLAAINALLPNLKIYKPEKCPKLETLMEDLRGPVSPTLYI